MEMFLSIMSITAHIHLLLLSNLVNSSLIARKDLRDIFDQLSVTRKSKITLNSDKSRSAPELFHEKPEKRKIGKKTLLTTRNKLIERFIELSMSIIADR
jgi:hypothetical protein